MYPWLRIQGHLNLLKNKRSPHLKKAAPGLYAAALPFKGSILSRIAPKRTNAELFTALASSIVSQQLSTKAAQSIFTRLKEALGGKITPRGMLDASPALLRSAGLSAAKVRTLTELSSALIAKELDLLSLKKASPEEAIAELTRIHGIGPWTAEMFLLFALGAPDVFSPGDLILERQMRQHMTLPETMPKKELGRQAEAWSPHRSFVSLLFWRLHHAELEQKQNSARPINKKAD